MPSNILFTSLLLLLAFTSVIADIKDDLKTCVKSFHLAELENFVNMKSIEELGVVCPKIFGFYDCIDDVLKAYFGRSLETTAILTAGTEAGKVAEIIVSTKNVYQELCTEGFLLNNDYRASAECFGRIQDPTDLCRREAGAAYEAFETFLENTDEEDGEDNTNTDKYCIKTAYMTACIASRIHDTCGRRAFKTFNTIVKRTTVYKNAICSEEGLGKLKTSFLNNLEMEEEERELFRVVFDLRKRRK